MTIDQKNQIRELIGVLLLAGVLVMSGMLLLKQKDVPATFTESTSVKSSVDSSGQVSNNKATALVNINKASLEELDTLPGIGPSTAQKIIDYRTQNGPFPSKEAIDNVSGIGPAKYSQIKDLISI